MHRRYLLILFLLLCTASVFASMSSVCASEKALQEKRVHIQANTFESLVKKADRLVLSEHLNRARHVWLGLYADSWTSRRMDEQLAEAVVYAVEQQFSDTSMLDRIRGMWNAEIMEQTLRACIYSAYERFGHNQRNLLRSLSGRYSKRISQLIPRYIEELKEIRLHAAAPLPGHKALVKLALEPNISKLLSSHPNKDFSTDFQTDQISSAGQLGLSSRRRRMERIILDQVTSEIVKGLTKDTENDTYYFLKKPFKPLGGGLILEEILHLGNEINTLPEKYQEALYQAMRDSFYIQAPRTVWKYGLRQQVEANAIKLQNDIKESFDSIFREFRSCGLFMQVATRFDQFRRDELVEKAFILKRESKTIVCDLMEHFGQALPDIKLQCISAVASSVNKIGLNLTGQWVQIAPTKACILGKIHFDYIQQFQPNARNFSHLLWLASLSTNTRRTAYHLDERTLIWLRLQEKTKQLELLNHKSPAKIVATMTAQRLSFPGASVVSDWMDLIKLEYLRLIDPVIPWGWSRWTLQMLIGLCMGVLICKVLTWMGGSKGCSVIC